MDGVINCARSEVVGCSFGKRCVPRLLEEFQRAADLAEDPVAVQREQRGGRDDACDSADMLLTAAVRIELTGGSRL
jgi:hypothetical protein